MDSIPVGHATFFSLPYTRFEYSSNRQQRLQQVVDQARELLGGLYTAPSSEYELDQGLARAQSLLKIFRGTPEETELNEIILQLKHISNDLRSWELGDASPVEIQAMLVDYSHRQRGALETALKVQNIDPAWDLEELYSSLIQERYDVAVRRSSEWIASRAARVQHATQLDEYQCENLKEELDPCPAFLSVEDKVHAGRLKDEICTQISTIRRRNRQRAYNAWAGEVLATDHKALSEEQCSALVERLAKPPCELTPEELDAVRAKMAEVSAHLDQVSLRDLQDRIGRLSAEQKQKLLEQLTGLASTSAELGPPFLAGHRTLPPSDSTGASSKGAVSDHVVSLTTASKSKGTSQGQLHGSAPTLSSHPTQSLPSKVISNSDKFEDETAYAATKSAQLKDALASISIKVQELPPIIGPRVVRLRVIPAITQGSKPAMIQQESSNLRLWLGVDQTPYVSIGKESVCVDIPRQNPDHVTLQQLLLDRVFTTVGSELRFPVGLSLENETLYGDLRKTPHWLLTGSVDSGLEDFVRTILLALLTSNGPESLNLLLLDPAGYLIQFRGLPHIYRYESAKSVILGTGREACSGALDALKLAAQEMDRRMQLMISGGTNHIDTYNQRGEAAPIPRILVVISSYTELVADESNRAIIENSLKRLIQMGRGAGIHLLILASDLVSHTMNSAIKAGIPGRLSFRANEAACSLANLDEGGAELLLGNGDLLLKRDGVVVRGQSPTIADSEIENLIGRFQPKLGQGIEGGPADVLY